MTFIQHLCSVSIVAIVIAGVAASGNAQTSVPQSIAVAPSTAIKPAPPFQVRVEGTGRPMILIPGLMCDGTVWNNTVDHFKASYQCHVLSLAGFAGVQPVEGPFIPTMRDAVVQYIRTKGLEKPIIIGHSLGGHLALAVAVELPQQVGPIIVVDGALALGALMSPGVSAEALGRQSTIMTKALTAMSQEAFAAQNRFMIAQLVQSPQSADWLAQIGGKSDVKTVARAMHEVMTADLRESVASIQSPVLLIGAAEFAKDDASKAAARERYEQQVAKIPHHKVAMVYDARHFVMLDKPLLFYTLVKEFLTP